MIVHTILRIGIIKVEKRREGDNRVFGNSVLRNSKNRGKCENE